jgi:hypothetical protein
MRNGLRERGANVIAEWKPNNWYAGKIYKISKKKMAIRFVDGDKKEFGRRTSKVIVMNSPLKFDKDYCGPYTKDHAEILALRGHRGWSKKTRWVVVERAIKRFGEWEFEWHVGRIIESRKKVPRQCTVRFNSGGDKVCHRPEGISFLNGNSPYILSGPYNSAEVSEMTGPIATSPLPKAKAPRIIKKPREPQPIRPQIGQRVIGKARSAFSGWFTGVITNIRLEQGITEISFDNGRRLGAPAAVEEFRPVSSGYVGTRGPISDDSARAIWKKFGLKE